MPMLITIRVIAEPIVPQNIAANANVLIEVIFTMIALANENIAKHLEMLVRVKKINQQF